MDKTNKSGFTEKIFFRVTSRQAEAIKAAASLDSRTISNWLRKHVVRIANEEIQAEKE